MEHHAKHGGASIDTIPTKTTKEGNPFIDGHLAYDDVKFVTDDNQIDAPLDYRIGEHFPGYASYLVDKEGKVVAYMFPLYRPGRPTIKIYTYHPAFEGQEPATHSKDPDDKDRKLYAWATFRMRGWHNTNVHYTLEYHEKDGSLRLAYDALRAGKVMSPWTTLVVKDSSGAVVARLMHDDNFQWSMSIAPTGVDPIIMTCMAASVEMLAKSQEAGNRIRNNPKLVFKQEDWFKK